MIFHQLASSGHIVREEASDSIGMFLAHLDPQESFSY
jgi:hypothetical protein